MTAGHQELLAIVQQQGSRRALAAMTDAELAGWIEACAAMAGRPAQASIARRRWSELLREAELERGARKQQR
jgi:hypothetical protein